MTYRRRPTIDVSVGDLQIGSNYPIRVQSMTISKTTDVEATIQETLGLVEVGCELVRVTVPTMKDAEAVKEIRDGLRARGCRVPLCADIHFMPAAALKVADYVEKVRINPGNYADTKRFAVKEYSDQEYANELERIFEKFKPLVLKLKENGGALRVGTNHGSLSDRIMNRFGDSPEGMVESAMEFLRMSESLGFKNIIVSMKSSNPVVMTQAYRLLAVTMDKENMAYPFHLGVTEAGDGDDGRIKSSIGIGNLLMDGLGDTVRVSLTENSVYEIPVCQKLVEPFNRVFHGDDPVQVIGSLVEPWSVPMDTHERRWTDCFRLNHFSQGANRSISETSRFPVAVEVSSPTTSLPKGGDTAIEVIHLENGMVVENTADQPSLIHTILLSNHDTAQDCLSRFPVDPKAPVEVLLRLDLGANRQEALRRYVQDIKIFKSHHENLRVGLRGEKLAFAYRYLDHLLRQDQLSVPLVVTYSSLEEDRETWLVDLAREAGGLFADGIGDAIWVDGKQATECAVLAYSVLQACRARISKTDFISCPSCGRTLFDLQTTTERIKSKVGHLKGVKVAIMGCIVNGPGEMADADFGYVGWGPGKINLYVGRDCVERNIPEDEADQHLIELIKKYGKWIDPPPATSLDAHLNTQPTSSTRS